MAIKTMWNIPRIKEEADRMLDIRMNNAIANEMMDSYLISPYCLNPKMNINGLWEKAVNMYGNRPWFNEDKVTAIIMICEIMRRDIIANGQNIPKEFSNVETCNYSAILESTEMSKRLDELMPTMRSIDDDFWNGDKYFHNIAFNNYNNITFRDMIFPPAMMMYYDIPEESGYSYHMNIGYVKDKFTVPCIMDGKKIIDWILPIEVNEARRAIKNAKGHVVSCGGGLSYFPYLASQNDNVTKITIIEMNQDFMGMLKEVLIPLFNSKCEIEIINKDPFNVISSGAVDDADFIYVTRITSINWYTDILKAQHIYKGNADFFYSDKASCIEHMKNSIWNVIQKDKMNLPVNLPETLKVMELLGDITLANPDSLKKLFMADWLWSIIS